MKKAGKHVENARKKVEARPYKLAEATELIKKTHHAKFNETVELAVNLGVDPKHSDQVVRGTVVLPNGLGKPVRVLVLAGGDKQREATGSRGGICWRRRDGAENHGRLDRLRRRYRHAGHDALGR